MVQYDFPEADPSTRFVAMANALNNESYPVVYQLCQWGVGVDLGIWAPRISNSWRISNDIINDWRSIWRITNQVVPFYKHTGVGAYADMDMLMCVGLLPPFGYTLLTMPFRIGTGGLTLEEERFHFGMWAINKSPLIIGCSIIANRTPAASLEIMKNKEVLAINQDSLGVQARLIRRFTEEQYDIWAGELSGDRKVIGIANWDSSAKAITLDLATVGVSFATAARDVWAASDLGSLSGKVTFNLVGHQLKLLVLSGISKAPEPTVSSYYSVATTTLTGGAKIVDCGTDCAPVGKKVGWIDSGSKVTFPNVSSGVSGQNLLSVDFINYEVALESSWSGGVNVRNMTIAVNGGTPKRWAFPISGGDWWETGSLSILVDGFVAGNANTVTFSGVSGNWAPDLVGFAVMK
jgi:alpha-galactosidase